MLERSDSYAGQARAVLAANGPLTRAQIRELLPAIRGKSVDRAIDALYLKHKLTAQAVPMLFPDGSTRRCFVYSLKAVK